MAPTAGLYALVGAGDIGSSGSLEYLVYFNALEGVAAKYGLRLVADYGDPALDAMFERVSRGMQAIPAVVASRHHSRQGLVACVVWHACSRQPLRGVVCAA